MDGELLRLITTVSKKAECVEQIDILLNGLSTNDSINLTQAGEIILKQLNTVSEKEKYLIELRNQVISLPEYRITIAFEPNNKHINQISEMVKSLHGPETVISVYVDPLLGAGATIEFHGKYFDGSVTKILSQEQ